MVTGLPWGGGARITGVKVKITSKSPIRFMGKKGGERAPWVERRRIDSAITDEVVDTLATIIPCETLDN